MLMTGSVLGSTDKLAVLFELTIKEKGQLM